jgi:hypothetical protein
LKDFCGEIEKKILYEIYLYIYISIIYRLAGPDLTPEERDARTVFCMVGKLLPVLSLDNITYIENGSFIINFLVV